MLAADAVAMTVRGPVPAAQIGFTLSHEHPYCNLRQARHRYDFPDQLDDDEVIVDELLAFREQGGSAIIDLTLAEIGRQPERLRQLSQRTGLLIVMGCGWYREPYYLPEERIDRRPVDDLRDELLQEIYEGVGTTGIRPGVIGEIGADKTWVSPIEERVHRAAARAQRASGLALVTHSTGPVAPEQLKILDEEGADLTRVAVGHCDAYPQLSYILGLLQRGVWAMFDNIGQYRQLGQWEDRVARIIAELLHRGYGERILLAHDTCKIPQLRYHGGPGFTYLADTFLPKLRSLGIGDAAISKMTCDNPRRWIMLPRSSLRTASPVQAALPEEELAAARTPGGP